MTNNNKKHLIILLLLVAKISFAQSTDCVPINNLSDDGHFEKIDCTNQLYLKGLYEKVDTLFTITKEGISMETYETMMIETTIDHLDIRKGKWVYRDQAGETLLEENYPGGSSGEIYTDFLCLSRKADFRTNRRKVNGDFIFFNAICQELGIDAWLSVDDNFKIENYYLNGRIINPPKVTQKVNNEDEYLFETTDLSISISTKSNDYAALGKLEDELKLSTTIKFSYANGIGEIIQFSTNNKTITRTQLYNGFEQGVSDQRNCNGQILNKGQYCQIDSFHRDTIVEMNYETWEEVVKITESDVVSKKCGTWQRFDVNGILVREEEYRDCEE